MGCSVTRSITGGLGELGFEAFAMMGYQCEDDSVIVEIGAPAGWVAGMCLETCGICGRDE